MDVGESDGIIVADITKDTADSTPAGIGIRYSSGNGFVCGIRNTSSAEFVLTEISGFSETVRDSAAISGWSASTTYEVRVVLRGTSFVCECYEGSTLRATLEHTSSVNQSATDHGLRLPGNGSADNFEFWAINTDSSLSSQSYSSSSSQTNDNSSSSSVSSASSLSSQSGGIEPL